MSPVNGNVLAAWSRDVDAAHPGNDAVARRIDRGRRNRRRLGEPGQQDLRLDTGEVQQAIKRFEADRGRQAERAAYRDHAAHQLGMFASECPSHDAAKAMTHETRFLSHSVRRRDQPLFRDMPARSCWAEIDARSPSLGFVTERRQYLAEASYQKIGAEQSGKHQHGMAIAARQIGGRRQSGTES
jgi:hypothetical protein